jgi:two-component system copper resistance phosphate regulon response regulator CusR
LSHTKILIVEHEIRVATSIRKGLEEEQFEVDIANDGEEGWIMVKNGFYDLLILDLNLPKLSGTELCRKIRAENIPTPILLMSTFGTADSKLLGLSSGADDYMGRPFRFAELMKRVRALLRRNISNRINQLYQVADLTLDALDKVVKRGEQTIILTTREFRLLHLLIQNAGVIVSKSDVSKEVWGVQSDPQTKLTDDYVNYLREKIEKDNPLKLIYTIEGIGYVLKAG